MSKEDSFTVKKSTLFWTTLIILFLAWSFWPSNTFVDNYLDSKSFEGEDSFSKVNEIHWTHMPLTYKIKSDYCANLTKNRIRQAFSTIENETDSALKFEEVLDDSPYEGNVLRQVNRTKIRIILLGEPGDKIRISLWEGRWPRIIDKNGTGILELDEISSDKNEVEVGVYFFETGITKTFYLEYPNQTELVLDITKPDGFGKKISPDEALSFEEKIKKENVDILIQCHKYFPYEQLDNLDELITQGDAQTDYYEGRIHGALINFYNVKENTYSGGCFKYPTVEVHEILHTFGFSHTENGIMGSLSEGCKYLKIEEKYINCLKHIYSNNQEQGNCFELNMYS